MCFRRKVKVNVCYATNLLPNEYCPSTVVRQYYKGQEPTTKCSLHHAPIPPDPPEPPTIKKCDIPYYKTGKLLCYTGFMLTDLCMKDGPTFKEADFPAYLDAITTDGANSLRSLSWGSDGTPDWDYLDPYSPEYFMHLKYRLGLVRERELTAIFCLTPYKSSFTDDQYRMLIRETKEFLPYIVYEAVNEPQSNDLQSHIVDILRQEGIPTRHIQIEHHDSSEFKQLLIDLGDGLATYHWTGTMDTVNGHHPIGWANSDGTMGLMALGMYGSNDGEDAARAAQGIYFFGLNPTTRRPSVAQLYEVTRWMLANGRGYENLSAAAFQSTMYPNLQDAISIGAEERRVMRRAYDEIYHA